LIFCRSVGSQSQEDSWSNPSDAWSPDRPNENIEPIEKPPVPSLSITKEAWASNESTEEALREGSEMLKDLLRVKKLSRRISSVESDGLPSMASVDIEDPTSESSDLQKARRLYAELTAKSMSIDSRESQEEIPDLDAAAKEFYDEIRALSMETGGSIENILESIGASTDSLASVIPMEKREQLANFEMNLKQMIEEAKQLADQSPGRSRDSLLSLDAPTEIDMRTRKSFSAGSQQSIVSVIEAPQPDFQSQVEQMAKQKVEQMARQTENFFEDEEPMPMSARGRPVKRTAKKGLHLDIPQQPPPQEQKQITPDPFKYKQEPDLTSYDFGDSGVEEQAPPLEELPPIKPKTPSPPKPAPAKSTPVNRRGQPINREPSVGSDRYEEIIVETRKRSLSRPGSRVSSRMGSRTSSQLDFRNTSKNSSQLDFKSNSSQVGEYGQSLGRLDLKSLRASLTNKELASLDLDVKVVNEQQHRDSQSQLDHIQEAPASMMRQQPPPPPAQPVSPPPVRQAAAPKPQSPVVAAPPTFDAESQIQPKMMALDANQNDTPASLPIAPPPPAARRPAAQYKPDPLVELFPKNIPTWVVLTYTYSVVLILILLVANSTPDGKLYIHFTALWSIILYFLIDEDQDDEIIDGLLIKGGFVK